MAEDTQTDCIHPESHLGSVNVGLLHLGHIPKCSKVPDNLFFFADFQAVFFQLLGVLSVMHAPGDFSHGPTENRSGFI